MARSREGGAPSQVQAKELSEALTQALGDLSEKHRSVFVLYSSEGLSYKEIASTLDISIGTVMSRLARARATLRLQFGIEKNDAACTLFQVEKELQ